MRRNQNQKGRRKSISDRGTRNCEILEAGTEKRCVQLECSSRVGDRDRGQVPLGLEDCWEPEQKCPKQVCR